MLAWVRDDGPKSTSITNNAGGRWQFGAVVRVGASNSGIARGLRWRLGLVVTLVVGGLLVVAVPSAAWALTGTTTSLQSSPNPSLPGQSVTFTATVSGSGGTPTGTMTFDFGDGSPVGATAVGTTVTHSYAAVGNYTATATYSGDVTFDTSSGTTTQNVAKKTTTTALGSTPNPSLSGQSVTFTATVSGSGGTPTGTMTFDFGDGGPVGATAVGTTVTHTYAALGNYTATATYSGDATFNTSSGTTTQSVGRTTTTALGSTPNPSLPGQSVSFTATVSGSGGTPTGTVSFDFGDGGLNGTVAVGTTVTHTYAALGNYTATATYNGDATFNTSSGTTTQSVGRTTTTALGSTPNPSLPGQSVSFTATVSGSGGTPTGSVSFDFGDGGLNGSSPVGSTVTHTYATVGSYTVTATYGGDATFQSSSGTTTQNVAKKTSTTALGSTPNPSLPGQSVSFTATVSGSGTPTGTVSFDFGDGGPNGAVAVGTTVTHTYTAVGNYTVTATYNGDATFNTSSGTTTPERRQDDHHRAGIDPEPKPARAIRHLHGHRCRFGGHADRDGDIQFRRWWCQRRGGSRHHSLAHVCRGRQLYGDRDL